MYTTLDLHVQNPLRLRLLFVGCSLWTHTNLVVLYLHSLLKGDASLAHLIHLNLLMLIKTLFPIVLHLGYLAAFFLRSVMRGRLLLLHFSIVA